MSDTPAAAPAAEASTTTQTTTETPAAPPVQEPPFLQSRLERERKAILKDLGIKVKRGEDPAAKIAEYKTDKEARRQERVELRTKVAEHEATIEKLSAAEAAVKVFADMEFNSLNEAQKAIVKAAAGDDPSERLKTIAIMKASAPPPVKAEAPPPAPIPAPAQTAPTSPAPAPGTSQPTDVKAEYQRLRSDPKNGLLAAAYLLQNRDAYYKQPT